MNIAFTAKSSNAKVGKIPVTTTSKASCPPACPLYDNGCYASAGFHTNMHWVKVTNGERGTDYAEFLNKIASLKPGQLWRHNVAGDLVGASNKINMGKLAKLTKANQGKRGFTYTHYPISDANNLRAVTAANNGGFTVNVSCNTPSDALASFKANGLPTVTIVASDFWGDSQKVGNIVRCPAEYLDTDCSKCQLCAHSDRQVIVGFTAHGTQSKSADIIAMS